jgi:DNA helicase HerA-like ATPase
MTINLFGESIGNCFERGVTQYPTVGDEVHLVTPCDLRVIYKSQEGDGSIRIGDIAASTGIPAKINLGPLVLRHGAIVGSTGSGKSNLVAVLMEAIATQGLQRARVLVIDPHGEYASAVAGYGRVFRVDADANKGELPLYVPYWALPFDEIRDLTLGGMQPGAEASIRDEIQAMKKVAARALTSPPPDSAVNADSPVPFSIKRLWFELDDFENQTFNKNQGEEKCTVLKAGDAEKLESNVYPPRALGSKAPFANPRPRGISRQLDLMRSRIRDARFRFLFDPGIDLSPSLDGRVKADLDSVVSSWVGHDKPITILDVSGLPSDALSAVVGTMLRIVYDVLFWAGSLPISGRSQPLLIVLEEAHIFLPEGKDSPATRSVSRIAKEGRKYGVGLLVVTQRPTEIHGGILSQCGTLLALRMSNSSDRNTVQSAMPDDLDVLASLLPSLRTGEGLVLGEAMPIPSRIRFFKAAGKPIGDDPKMPAAWQVGERPAANLYAKAVENWRSQTFSGG